MWNPCRLSPIDTSCKADDEGCLASLHKENITCLLAVKWLVPAFTAAFGWYIQSIGLHYATYQYVHHMMALDEAQRTNSTYATLPDPVAEGLGKQENINLHALDMIAAAFPFTFMVLAVWKSRYTLQVWTKVMLCAFFLFCAKGIIGAVTTEPDSSGWEVCKERLHASGLEWMKDDHSFFINIVLDIKWFISYHHPLRYCSDMMYSGHTFVVTLFALGCYEVLRININLYHADKEIKRLKSDKPEPATNKQCSILWHIFALAALSIIAIAEQAVEMYCVLISRFHYTSDVLMALVMVFLMYTNAAISVFAKQWEILGPLSLVPHALQSKILPHIHPKLLPSQIGLGDALDERYVYVSRGDAYVPWCCIPFCFGGGGRMHIYSDAGVHRLYERLAWEKKKTEYWRNKVKDVREFEQECVEEIGLEVEEDETYLNLKMEMNLDEGIDMKDISEAFPSIEAYLGPKLCNSDSDPREAPCTRSSSFTPYRHPYKEKT